MNQIAMLVAAAIPLVAIADPITLKGLAPGMTKDQLETTHKGTTSLCSRSQRGAGAETCGYATNKGSLVDIPALDTFAGAKVNSWLFLLRDGVVTTIMISLHTDNFDRVVAATEERWGRPSKREESTVQNRMGASFRQVEATWAIDNSVLVIRKRRGKIDEMGVYLSTEAMIRDDARERDARPKSDAKDM